MKILIVSTTVVKVGGNRYGGIEKLVSDFAYFLIKKGHKVTIAAPLHSKVPQGCDLIETVILPQQQDNDMAAIQKYGPSVKDFDVVHDFSHSHLLSRDIAYVDGNPVTHKVLSMLWDPVVVRYIKAPYNIICVSKWQAQRFIAVYQQDCAIVEPGVDLEKFTHSKNHGERFLFLAKIGREKGVLEAIKYCKQLNVPLDVAGGMIASDSKEYVTEVRNHCDNKQIKLHFNVTEEEKIDLLQNAKALIYPVQQDESHWLAGIEAWATGCPTITFNKGAMNEITTVGSVVDNEEQFINAMKKVDKVDTQTIRTFAETRYDMGKNINNYTQMYNRVIGGELW